MDIDGFTKNVPSHVSFSSYFQILSYSTFLQFGRVLKPLQGPVGVVLRSRIDSVILMQLQFKWALSLLRLCQCLKGTTRLKLFVGSV